MSIEHHMSLLMYLSFQERWPKQSCVIIAGICIVVIVIVGITIPHNSGKSKEDQSNLAPQGIANAPEKFEKDCFPTPSPGILHLANSSSVTMPLYSVPWGKLLYIFSFNYSSNEIARYNDLDLILLN